MSDNSRITIILSIAMSLAVISAVLLFVYLFYRAQTRRYLDIEALQPRSQGSKLWRNKPLPPAPHVEAGIASVSPPQRSGPNERSSPSILQRRQATRTQARGLPLRDLHLGYPAHNNDDDDFQHPQEDPSMRTETIPVGLSPDLAGAPSVSTPRIPRLSRPQISRPRESIRRAPAETEPIWESAQEEQSATLQGGSMPVNRF